MSADNPDSPNRPRLDPRQSERLNSLVEGIRNTENRSELAEGAQAFLATLPLELIVLAEDDLIEAGYLPTELRHPSSTEMADVRGTDLRTRAALTQGHLLATLYTEHDLILGNVEDLDYANALVQVSEDYDKVALMASQLQVVAENLLAAAPHHRREEDLLFPMAERHGLVGPPAAMSAQHARLDYRKMRLHAICASAASLPFAEFKKQLNATARMLSLEIRDHIFRENNVLYPAVLAAIDSPEVWEEMARTSEEIGICDFWPRAAVVATSSN